MGKLGTMLQVGRTFGMRDGILRLEYELQRGSGLMSWRMRSVQGWQSWDLQRIAPGPRAEEIRIARKNGARKFFFPDAPALAASIQNIIGSRGEASVLAAADQILQGNLPFFGQLSFACDFPPQWFRNPATGRSVSPEQPWTQMRFASPFYGDLKFILEPSRFLFVYPLSRAYALSGDERFPRAFWSAVEDWAHHSPPMAGPLWICGQECSLRILAWSFALHAFINSPSTTDDRVALLTSMIAAHAWRTAQTLGYARSQRSNHQISEAVGLWTAGTLYPELREAQVWQEVGSHLLHEAVVDQITPQGVSQQHSFNYQRMNLHLLLWMLRLAEVNRISLHPDIHARTAVAFDFIHDWVDAASGMTPNYGSNDGSLIFPLSVSDYRDFRPLLQLGAAVLNRPALPRGPWDEAALWFGAAPVQQKVRDKTIQGSAAMLDVQTGYFRLGDKNSWALVRAGRYTRRPFQADQLHVDLWWQGINLARDAGTYLYNGSAPWNNGLASTSIHNTVTIDGRDQMRRASRFLWLDWAQASAELHTSPGHNCPDRFEGEHNGYRNFGVTHRRTVQWLDGDGWVIVDDIQGTGQRDVRLHWLTADLPCKVSSSPFEVLFRLDNSRIQLSDAHQEIIRWNIFSSAAGTAAIIRAGKQTGIVAGVGSQLKLADEEAQLFGWESPTYGDLQPAVSLVYQTRSPLPIRFVTTVLTGAACKLEAEGDHLAILRNGCELYRVNLSAQEKAIAEIPSAVSVSRA